MSDIKEFYERYWDYSKKIKHLAQEGTPPNRLIIAQSMMELRNKKKILDIGCGGGGLGKLLRQKFGNNVYLVGIDISEAALQMASKYYDKTMQMNIDEDSFDNDILNDKFNYIVCLEVLEHIIMPENVLNKLKKLLASDGMFIISFPNFAFYRYRWEVLKGNFPDGQHLFHDAEHIHYWTFHSFKKFLNKNGLKIINYELDFDMPLIMKLLPSSIKMKLAKKIPNLFGIQIITKCKVVG